MEEDKKEVVPSSTKPKTSQLVLAQVKADYLTSNFKSVSELAETYGIHKTTLNQRIIREKWEDQRLLNLKKLEEKLVKSSVSIGEEYLKRTYKRMEKYEKLIDVSMANLGSKDAEGNSLLDPDALNTYTLSEMRIHEISKSALRIPDTKNLDITSQGKSIGDSLVSALCKLRETDKSPPLSDADCSRILDAEVIDEDKE